MYKPTVQDILEAYETTGLEPQQGVYYFRASHCGCAAGAFAVANMSPKPILVFDWLANNIPHYYLMGLVDGFDADISRTSPTVDKEYRDGREVGVVVREIILEGKGKI